MPVQFGTRIVMGAVCGAAITAGGGSMLAGAWNGLYPFIDYAAGGSIDGMIRAANTNVSRATQHTLVVPGHGPVGDRAQLIEFRDMLVDVRAKVAALKAQGKSLDEVTAAKPTAAYDAKWGGAVINPALFTALVYKGV